MATGTNQCSHAVMRHVIRAMQLRENENQKQLSTSSGENNSCTANSPHSASQDPISSKGPDGPCQNHSLCCAQLLHLLNQPSTNWVATKLKCQDRDWRRTSANHTPEVAASACCFTNHDKAARREVGIPLSPRPKMVATKILQRRTGHLHFGIASSTFSRLV